MALANDRYREPELLTLGVSRHASVAKVLSFGRLVCRPCGDTGMFAFGGLHVRYRCRRRVVA